MESKKPFTETLQSLMETQDIGNRALATRTQEVAGWGTSATITQLKQGKLAPSVDAMMTLADALGEDPSVFAEYRLWLYRRQFDETEVGFKAALRNLDGVERGKAPSLADAAKAAARPLKRSRPKPSLRH